MKQTDDTAEIASRDVLAMWHAMVDDYFQRTWQEVLDLPVWAWEDV